jgi:ParB-like chromosome segregation protein Spo0J
MANLPVEQQRAGASRGDGTVSLQVGLLKAPRTLRCGALDGEHVLRLVETGGEWPPLLVRGRDLTVIDGAHRLAAALQLGLDTIEVELFEGSEIEELVEALRRNSSHGLPLTLLERKNAARQVLFARAEWSDRMIGKICGLAAGTVKSLRVATGAAATVVPLERRLGRDGRTRPARPAEQRRKIAEALSADPGVSARIIAHRVGVAPATVRAVSETLQPGRVKHLKEFVGIDSGSPGPAPVDRLWTSDSACSSTEESVNFAGWFDRTCIDMPTCLAHVTSVPLSRVYEVADESRRRAQVWADFAAALQRRPGALLRSRAQREVW